VTTSSELLLVIGCDIAAITTLTYGIYFRRHRRRDMLIAYLALNVGVMSVTLVLAGASVAAGLGLGLFGVLSIIRLRSSALTQEEVAYYFASLVLGLVAGLRPDPVWVTSVVLALVVAVMYVADHPRIYAQSRHQTLVLDRAITDEQELEAVLTGLLRSRVHRFIVVETDLVRDVTTVDVRYSARTAQHIEPVTTRTEQSEPTPVGLSVNGRHTEVSR
jgi:hypothetical protein